VRTGWIVAACGGLLAAGGWRLAADGPPLPARSAGDAGRPAGGVQSSAALRSLEGVWSFSTLTPLERPAEFAGKALVSDAEAAAWVRQNLARNNRDRRDGGADVDVGRAVNDYWFERGTELAVRDGQRMTSLIVDPPDGRLPALTAEARARLAARAADNREHPADGPENRSLQERCLSFNAGPPMLPGPYNNYVQILLFPGYAVIVTEMIHDARVVPLEGRVPGQYRGRVPGPEGTRPPLRRWLGEPRGHWDGATLVVDSTNFTANTNLRGADEQLRLTERFTPVDHTTLFYEFTVDDPTAFARPWTAALPMTRTADRLFEYACHEGNYALMDILRGARYQEKPQ